jgi:FkbM family methyltransferase
MSVFVKEGVTYVFNSLTGDTEGDNWLNNFFLLWEPNTFKVFKALSNKDKIAIDIGAWIGLTPIWLCKNFKHVICIEADKESIKSLEINLKSSDCTNYEIINKAIYSDNRRIYFGPNKFKHDSKLNDSMCQIKYSPNSSVDYEIETITVNDILKNIDASTIGLIKVDIEGGEEYILSDLLNISKKYNITLYISFHLSWWNNIDISRFALQLSEFDCYINGLDYINEPINYIQHNHFESLLIKSKL